MLLKNTTDDYYYVESALKKNMILSFSRFFDEYKVRKKSMSFIEHSFIHLLKIHICLYSLESWSLLGEHHILGLYDQKV